MTVGLRLLVLVLLAVLVAVAGLLISAGLWNVAAPVATPGAPLASGSPVGSFGAGATAEPTVAPTPTPRPPAGGTELYGYLPYWQMNASMATYLQSTPLTTLALFSVTSRASGALNTNATGYRRITGTIGRQLIDEAHARDARVELVFTSFGADRNAVFFGRVVPAPAGSPAASPGLSGPTAVPTAAAAGGASVIGLPSAAPTAAVPPWHQTVDELVALASDLGVDGVNVDVELLDAADRAAYGAFLAELRAELRAAIPDATLSVATEAGMRGIDNATVANAAGVDRLFLMGYDYHWSGSQPGASSPIDRTDGLYTLRWSIDRYVEAGIPRNRILLGLPLYGMKWRLQSPSRTALVIGSGVTWVPSQHRALLMDPAFHPGIDTLELAHVVWEPDGGEWLVTYYDSPATLRPKLALAVDSGLAGAGFWAMGYERGLPGYLDLMHDFRAGSIPRSEAPPRQPPATPQP